MYSWLEPKLALKFNFRVRCKGILLDSGQQNRHVCLYSSITITTLKKINSTIPPNTTHHPKYIHYACMFLFFSSWSKIQSGFTHCFWLLCLWGLPQSKISYYLPLFFLTLNPLKSPVVLKNVPYFRLDSSVS